MASQHASTALRMERMGLPLLAPTDAIQALEAAVRAVSGFSTGIPVQLKAPTAPPSLVPALQASIMAKPAPGSRYGSGSVAVLSVHWPVFLKGLSLAAATSPFFASFSHLLGPRPRLEASRHPGPPAPEPGTISFSADPPPATAAKDEAALKEVSALVAESVKNITGKGRLTDKLTMPQDCLRIEYLTGFQ